MKPTTQPRLAWKIGFELELMAPRGSSRAALAARVADESGGRVRRFFHPQSEPSKAPGLPIFENLTLGYEAVDAAGRPLARFVDDLTLQDGLDRRAPPRAGWYRIVSDDPRLLRLIVRHCDAAAAIETVLDPVASLFGVRVKPAAGGMVRVEDEAGASVAIAAPLPGERERPCEIVTPPFEEGHAARLGALLDAAAAAGFTVPAESATHLHFDAGALRSARAVANLVTVLTRHGEALKAHFRSNPRCVRLGPWPAALPALVRTRTFREMPWPAARAALAQLPLTKYCDFNLVNLVTENPVKHTFEVRILPGGLAVAPIIAAASFFAALLRWCVTRPYGRRMPATLAALAAELRIES